MIVTRSGVEEAHYRKAKDMRKFFGVTAMITAAIIFTGCTEQESDWKGDESGGESDWGTGNYWENQETAKEWEEIDREIAKGDKVALPNGRDAECLQALNVIGIGNPGTDYLVIKSVFDSIKAQVIKDVKDIDPKLVTLTIPTYEGIDMVTPKHLDLSDGSLDSVRTNAAKAVSDATREAQDNCAGSKTVLLANGFGASVAREAESIMNPISARSVSRMVLITDPNRSRSEAVDTLSVGSSEISKLDGSAAGKLNYSGLAKANSFDPVIRDKILSVCHPLESICNDDPDIPRGFNVGPGQEFVLNIALYEKAYVLPQVMSLIAEWVAEKSASDFEAAAALTRDTYADLTDYLSYVNRNNDGAKVVQDTPDPAAIAGVCEADYAVFTTRGSGENIDGNANSEYRDTIDNSVGYKGGQAAQPGAPVIQGLTRFPATLAWEITSKLPSDKKIRFIPVYYDAIPVPIVGRDASNLGGYNNSVKRGVAQMSSDLGEFQKKCPETPIILIGYSQGAQVIHATLAALPESATSNINSVLLIADPLMNSLHKNNGIEYDARADNDKGAFTTYSFPFMGISAVVSAVPLPDHIAAKVLQICDVDDIVCQAGTVDNLRSISVHSEAYSKESHYVAPARFAVEKLTGNRILDDKQRSDIEAQ